MVAQRSLSIEQVSEARNLRHRGYNFRQIARGMNVHPETIHRAIDAKYRKYRQQKINEARSRREAGAPKISLLLRNEPSDRVTVPIALIVERDYRVNLPRSITSMLCGDPAPGYSALDRR